MKNDAKKLDVWATDIFSEVDVSRVTSPDFNEKGAWSGVSACADRVEARDSHGLQPRHRLLNTLAMDSLSPAFRADCLRVIS